MSPAPSRGGAGKHVLVLEDDPTLQALIQKALTGYGFSVAVVGDGLEGLVELEKKRPDLILTDVMMPRLDGISFVRAVKAREETRQIPVIFLTAKSDARSMIDGINVGARFYLTKPFTLTDLMAKVSRALNIAIPS